MVILVESYRLKYARWWLGGDPRPRWEIAGIESAWDEFMVINEWDVRRINGNLSC